MGRTSSRRPQTRVVELREASALVALGHPTRVALLDLLHEPASAAAAARELGEPRQRVNHHLQALVDAGLVVQVGTRRRGGFIETLYRSIRGPSSSRPRSRGATLVACKRSVRSIRCRRWSKPADGFSATRLRCSTGRRSTVRKFRARRSCPRCVSRPPTPRAEFMQAYLEQLRTLLDEYASNEGEAFRVVVAVHPEPGEEYR